MCVCVCVCVCVRMCACGTGVLLIRLLGYFNRIWEYLKFLLRILLTVLILVTTLQTIFSNLWETCTRCYSGYDGEEDVSYLVNLCSVYEHES
jgi:hypothetical protein